MRVQQEASAIVMLLFNPSKVFVFEIRFRLRTIFKRNLKNFRCRDFNLSIQARFVTLDRTSPIGS